MGQEFEAYLLESGALSAKALDRVWKAYEETGPRTLVRTIVDLGLMSQPDMASVLSRYTGYARRDADCVLDDALDIPGLSLPFIKEYSALPLYADDEGLTVAVADPTDLGLMRALEFAAQVPMIPQITTFREVEEALAALKVEEGGQEGSPLDLAADDIARLKELASDAPVIRYVDRVIEDAFTSGASDIHFEPQEAGLRLRTRIDGLLHTLPPPPPDMRAAIISRLKIMAGLDIAERRLPQDGRIVVRLHGRSIDLRVSTAPTAYGESVVLRLLDAATLPKDFASLGFSRDASSQLIAALKQPEGIVLVTGPTGSGKTTTLYAGLVQVNSPQTKILTVEDPVEYMIEGINQVQVDRNIGRTFASTLRSFLRQDPDILMVGEIRDRETADVAVEAAMTGHLVLSTLHTNDAATAIVRLLDMGVEDFLISSTVSLVVGQRLVRCLCPHCRQPVDIDPSLSERLPELQKHLDANRQFFGPKGCDSCRHTGYQGRTCISEILPITDDIRALIQRHAEAREIEAVAIKAGMQTILSSGLEKAAAGETSIEEVLRVTRED